MKIGISLKGSQIVYILMDGDKIIENKNSRIELEDDLNDVQIKSIFEQLTSIFVANNVTDVRIKKRAQKGNFAGGAVSFKLEGIIQLVNSLTGNKNINFVNSRKLTSECPDSIKKYELEAYQLAALTII